MAKYSVKFISYGTIDIDDIKDEELLDELVEEECQKLRLGTFDEYIIEDEDGKYVTSN